MSNRVRRGRRWRVAWLLSIAILSITTPIPGDAQSSTTFVNRVSNALDDLCTAVDISQAVEAGFLGMADALSPISGTPNEIGTRGERAISDALDDANIGYEREVGFEGRETRRVRGRTTRGRRGDFRVGNNWIETKHTKRITSRNVVQIRDYNRGHTILTVRRGAKISRLQARRLRVLVRAGLLTVLECAFT